MADPYSVTFPDGHVQSFDGPKDMTDSEVMARALQERGVAEGRIQTTWFGGAGKALGEDSKTTGALMTGAGMLTGTAPVVAAAPLVSRWIQYATQKMTGQNPETPSIGEQAVLGATGLAGAYGPKVLSGSGSILGQEAANLPGNTVPQAAMKVGARLLAPVADQAQLVTPEAVGSTTADLAALAAKLPKQISLAVERTGAGITAEDYALMRHTVSQGLSPYAAAKAVTSGNAKQLGTLLKLYLKYK